METREHEDRKVSRMVAEGIRVEMARQMIRQSELARRIGENDQWLSVRVRGVQSVDVDDLYKIADGLGVSALTLLPSDAKSAGQGSSRDRVKATEGYLSRSRQDSRRPISGPPSSRSDLRKPNLLRRSLAYAS